MKHPTKNQKRKIVEIIKYFGWDIIDKNRLFNEYGKIIEYDIKVDGNIVMEEREYFEIILDLWGEDWDKQKIIKIYK